MSIEKFRFKSIKVLPTVYEDALSYYETLSKISAKLNEVIEQLNQLNIEELIQENLNAYTESTVKPLIANAKAVLESKIDNLSDDYYAYRLIINRQIEELENRVTVLSTNVAGIEERCNDYTDQKVASIVYELPLMPSPISGNDVTVFQAIYELAGMLRYDSLTATEYDALALTATAYDNKNVTAFNYDWHGKTALA